MTKLFIILLAAFLSGCPVMWYDPDADPSSDALPSHVDRETALAEQCFDARAELDGFVAQQADGVSLNAEDRAERALTERFVAERCSGPGL